MKRIIIPLLIFPILSCKNQIEFEKSAWLTMNDMFPCKCREQMIDDLTKNHKLVGLKVRELEKLLGTPDSKVNLNMTYDLVVKYGSDIDPIYMKYLNFNLNSDSVVEKYEIKEWKK